MDRRKKRVLCSIVMCLALAILALAPVSNKVQAADSDFTVKNGVLTSYTGSGGTVTIPSTVTEIGDGAFFERENLKEVTIPATVTTIGDYAFAQCENLTTVKITKGVEKIGGYAFYDCPSLTKVTIPTTVTTIGVYAFSDCASLKNITIPKNVTEIHAGAFENCSKLTKIVFKSKNCVLTSSDSDNDDSGNIFFNNFDPDNAMETISKAVTIQAYSGSTAQEFAQTITKEDCGRTVKYEVLNDTLEKVTVSSSLNITAGKTKTIKVTLPDSVKQVTEFTKKSGQVMISYKVKATGDDTFDTAVSVNKSGKVSLKNYSALKSGTTFTVTTTVKMPNGDSKKFTTKFTVKK